MGLEAHERCTWSRRVAGWIHAWGLRAGDGWGCKEGRTMRGAPGKSDHAHSVTRSTAQATKRATPSGLGRPFCALAFSRQRRAALSPPASLSAGVAPPASLQGLGLAAARVARPPQSSSKGKSSAELISVAVTWGGKAGNNPAYTPACLPTHSPPAHPPTHPPSHLANKLNKQRANRPRRAAPASWSAGRVRTS